MATRRAQWPEPRDDRDNFRRSGLTSIVQHAANGKGLKRVWRGLFQRAGLTGATLPYASSQLASVAANLGYAEATIGALLGHASGTVTGRYTHVLDAVLIAAANRVAATVHGYMTGEPGEQKARQLITVAA